MQGARRAALCAAALCAAAHSAAAQPARGLELVLEDDARAPSWDEFKAQFAGERVWGAQALGGANGLSLDSEARRRAAYEANVAYIAKRNREQSSFRLGVNHLADLDRDAYSALMLRPMEVPARARAASAGGDGAASNVPDAVDWRTKGAVSEVKNQAQCGSCWAFATVGAVEGAYAIATGALRSLSEQELVDCSSAEGNKGCLGGNLDFAMQYIVKNGGLDTEEDYPYAAKQNECAQDRSHR
jgi:C1A family cysteine protease